MSEETVAVENHRANRLQTADVALKQQVQDARDNKQNAKALRIAADRADDERIAREVAQQAQMQQHEIQAQRAREVTFSHDTRKARALLCRVAVVYQC